MTEKETTTIMSFAERWKMSRIRKKERVEQMICELETITGKKATNLFVL